MDSPYFVALIAVGIGALLVIGGVKTTRARKKIRALILVSFGLASAAIGLVFGAIGLSINVYHHLSAETYLLDLAIEQQAPQQFTVRLLTDNAQPQSFRIAGDEWMLEARILKWKPWATALGFKPLVRMERLGGRYIDINHELSGPRTLYGLADDRSPNIWRWANRAPSWLPGLDTAYGTATYLPLAHGARYAVFVSPNGVLARAVNRPAEEAVSHWRRETGL